MKTLNSLGYKISNHKQMYNLLNDVIMITWEKEMCRKVIVQTEPTLLNKFQGARLPFIFRKSKPKGLNIIDLLNEWNGLIDR